MLPAKLKALDDYINEALRNGWIRELKSLTGIPIPFGLTNASATFQAYINHTLRGYVDIFYIVYLNDILIFSKSEVEHYKHLDLVIKRLYYAELYVNPKKYEFLKLEVEYLGFIIN